VLVLAIRFEPVVTVNDDPAPSQKL
jgi:hypothetical protein